MENKINIFIVPVKSIIYEPKMYILHVKFEKFVKVYSKTFICISLMFLKKLCDVSKIIEGPNLI